MASKTTISGITTGIAVGLSMIYGLCFFKRTLFNKGSKTEIPDGLTSHQRIDLFKAFKYQITEYGQFTKSTYETRMQIVMKLVFGERKQQVYIKNPQIMHQIHDIHDTVMDMYVPST